MPTTLLATKLYCPPVREALVSRPRLVDRLDHGLLGSLVLISAPPGYGKTTLISEWRATRGQSYPLAWITLDPNDNDLARFLAYFVAALRTIYPNLGGGVLDAMHSTRQPLYETILSGLINELSEIDQPLAVVLDDYHVIGAHPVHEALSFLIDHLPANVHLVILTRADPPLRLSRLRARDQLTEIRLSDLRFNFEEAGRFLNQVMQLGLSEKDIRSLEGTTEGWIAGLQLAALSMRGREDVQGFVSGFTGSHHFIADYLIEEVLNRQTPETKDFLLKTSILDRMTGALCDELTGMTGGQGVLEQLEHNNLFVIPLDDKQQWYRFHHLFAELLLYRLQRVYPGLIPKLYQQASRWCFLNGLSSEAIEYAISGGDFEQAALLIEEGVPSMQKRGEFRYITTWLGKLPEEVLRFRPRLCIAYAWALAYSSGAPDKVERYLQYADQVIEGLPTSAVIKDLLGQIACIRANVAVYVGDNKRALELCAQAQALLSPENAALRSYTTLLEADAAWMMGDGPATRRALEKAIQLSRKNNDLQTTLITMNYLARVLVAHGLLRQAKDIYYDAIQLASDLGGLHWPALGIIYVGLGMLLWEQNESRLAQHYLTEGVELASQANDIDSLLFGYTALARIYHASGQKDQAQEIAGKAERVAHETRLARDRYRVAVRQTRLMLAIGDIQGADKWLRELSECVEEYSTNSNLQELSPLRISVQVMRARVLIAQGRPANTEQILTPLLGPSEAAGRMRSVAEMLALQAIAFQAQGELPKAIAALSRAMEIAEPEGYIRLFVDEGYPMAQLLRRMLVEGKSPKAYIQELLAAFSPLVPEPEDTKTSRLIRLGEVSIESLSLRELEVLRLIAKGCSNQEIADQMVLAIGTIKRHTANIFEKLGVHNRTEAVARARELKLL